MKLRPHNFPLTAPMMGLLLAAGCASPGGGDTPGTGGKTVGKTAGTGGSAAGMGGVAGGTNPGMGGAQAGTGGAGNGATGGRAGGAGGRAGGAAGGSGNGGAVATGGAGGGVIWPNDMSKANSDTWLSQNHDRITQLQPRVLVIDLENTAGAQALIDKHIAALKEATSPHKFKDPTAQPAMAYQFVKTVQAPQPTGAVNYNSWNTQAFADSNLQIKDPADPTGPNLTLCGLFEKGVVNEVWCMAKTDGRKCGETQEAKQVYNADGTKKAGSFVSASNGDNINSLGCKVTVRITDFNSGRGVGCHQHAMGHAWERYMDAGAVPMLGKQAKRFLNWDMTTRLGAPFSNFYNACNSNSTQLTNCIVWNSQINAASGITATRTFNIADMSQGCGNAHFYPNTTGTYSYDANTPDPTVLTACENYGLHNSADGVKDLTTPFNNAMTDTLYRNLVDDDCGGHGTMYLYQNFPGPGTKATNDDGTPMQNWWVYLFY